ncbi:MAG TPA: hypothetical protein VH561_10670 [Micromonosporaceae bacterium]
MHRTGAGPGPELKELLAAGHRRLAWAAFVLLAAEAPLTAWLRRGDAWLLPLSVAGMVAYAIVVDDQLRHRAAARQAALPRR